MDNFMFHSYAIEDRSYVSFIKREIHNFIRPKFSETRTGEIDIVVSEMCSNVIKYANRGELLYRLSTENDESVFELICIDNGVGMKDVSHSSKDGISSKNTLGQGIGAINRMSNFSQIYSVPNWGTIVYSKFYQSINHKILPEKLLVRCINVALPGETVSGDSVAYRILKDKSIIFAGDGLGHGIHAKEAVDKAIAVFDRCVSNDPAEMIKEIHDGVKKTRGLVGTVAILDHGKKKWELCGVGNISARVQKGLMYKNYVSNNGVIGLNIPKRLENSIIDMEALQLLILCSDGIKTKWDLLQYPSILKYDPIILASAIYKDHGRKTDDMTVLIIKVV